jgi:thymidylate kinase
MFIVLDAIDGAGKGRQRIEVADRLDKEYGLRVKTQDFPVHNAFYETVIHPALQGEKKMNSASWVLSYLLDKTLMADTINEYIGNKEEIFISDGYFTTTLAYQSYLMQQVEVDKLLQYAEEFKIPKPDFAIYLDVDPKIAFERKAKEEGHEEGLDIFEGDLVKQEKLRKIFQDMVKDQIYCEWEIVDGNNSIEEVTDAIIQIFKKRGVI